jgi:hypothetical protein
MGLLRRGGRAAGTVRRADGADRDHLVRFVRAHPGVEAYVEPRTTVTEATLVLVAPSGEWTRRRVPGPEKAAALMRKHNVPLYDAAKVGYPPRMREWTAQRKAAGT